jgi:uncharacterized protein YndB with AHSA1/START domain
MMTTAVSDRIEKQVLLRAPRSRVWRALTDSREFGSWFGVKFDGPFKAGERIIGKIAPTTVDPQVAAMQKPYEGMTFDITIDRIEPEKMFSFRWHPFAIDPKVDYSHEPTTLVVFELKDAPEGIMLTVTESGFNGIPLSRRAEAFKMNEGGWAAQMTLIEKYLAKAS